MAQDFDWLKNLYIQYLWQKGRLKMKIKMTLLSDAIPGNGESVPGGEDISVLRDEQGFPYFKGGTLKGIFREELTNYLVWTGKTSAVKITLDRLLGNSGDNHDEEGKLRFSDLRLSADVQDTISKQEIEGRKLNADEILDAFTYMRAFTSINEDGMVEEGSLRYVRCLKRGLIFYGELRCEKEDENTVKAVLGLIKWVGTMRNRGFGNVIVEVI